MTNFIDKHSQFFAIVTVGILALGLIAAAVAGFFFLHAAPGEGTLLGDMAYIFIAATAPLFAMVGVGIAVCLVKDEFVRQD